MSLKAKIEAVIYASEEPVTLAQLTGLLGQEAQAELDRMDAAQSTLELEEAPADADTLNSEILAGPEDEEAPLPETAPEPSPAQADAPETATAIEDKPAEKLDEKRVARDKERRLR